MPAVSPSGVGCTGVAYSIGYNARCDSTALRTSSLSSTVTVLIHVIELSFFRPNACCETETNKPENPAPLQARRETPVLACQRRAEKESPPSSRETRSAGRDNPA